MKTPFIISFVALMTLAPTWAYKDPETDTFLTRDPLGFVDGPNLYTYVVQNPWTYFDPTGLKLVVVENPRASGKPEYDTFDKSVNRPGFEKNVNAWLSNLKEMDPRLNMAITDLEESDNVHYMVPTDGGSSVVSYDINATAEGESSSTTIYINETQTIDDQEVPTEVIVGHEVASHTWDRDHPKGADVRITGTNPNTGVLITEERAVRTENIVREKMGLPLRTEYRDKPVENYQPQHSALTHEYNRRQQQSQPQTLPSSPTQSARDINEQSQQPSN